MIIHDCRKIRVALVKPPLQKHQQRGTGIYTANLFETLSRISEVHVSLIEIGSDISGFDIIHYPYFDLFFLTLPILKKKITVVTVHDLIPLKYPKQFKVGMKGLVKWQIQKLSLKNSQAIITDSETSKRDIIEFTDIEEGKIFRIYLGVDKEFKVVNSKKNLTYIQSRYRLPENFLLYVGDVNYNKNIEGLIKSFKEAADLIPSLKLVLIGQGFKSGSAELSCLTDLINSLKLNDRIIRLGNIKKEDLISIYNLAKIYIQPSFYEGFGLPVLEAMACGCPVISADTSSLSEIVQDSALMINPYRSGSIRESIIRLYNDEEERRSLIEKGLDRIKSFSWEKCASETVSVYKKVINYANSSAFSTFRR